MLKGEWYQGFTIKNQQSFTTVGVLNKEDVLKSIKGGNNMVDWNHNRSAAGGSFFGDLFGKIRRGVQTALPYIKKYGPAALSIAQKLAGGKLKKRVIRRKRRGGAFTSQAELQNNMKKHGGSLVSNQEDDAEYTECSDSQ